MRAVNPAAIARLTQAPYRTNHYQTPVAYSAIPKGLGFPIPGSDPTSTGATTPTDPEAIQYAKDVKAAWDNWFGTGRQEADIIVPVQNLLTSRLDAINAQLMLGQNPSLATLQSLFTRLKELWATFYYFVSGSQFTDGRASAQALNTMAPIIDGTCGYQVHNLHPTQYNCQEWGSNQIGGTGRNGMLGVISRAIQAKGGSATYSPDPLVPVSTMGLSTPVLVGIGILALFMFSKKRMF